MTNERKFKVEINIILKNVTNVNAVFQWLEKLEGSVDSITGQYQKIGEIKSLSLNLSEEEK